MAAACIASPAHAQSADWVQQVARTTASKQAYPKTAQARREQGSAKVKIFLVASGAAERAELIAPTGPTALDRAGPRSASPVQPHRHYPPAARRRHIGDRSDHV